MINGDGLDYLVGFLFFSISNISRMLQQFIGVPREISYVVYIALLALFFIKYIRRIRLFDLMYYVVFGVIVAYGLFMYSRYIDSSTRVYAVVLLFLPTFLFFRVFDPEKLFKVFIASQYFASVYLLFYYVIDLRNQTGYSMDYAYWVVIPICTMFYLYMERGQARYLIFSGVMLVTLVLAGCRGALLLGIACIAYLYMARELQIRKTVGWYIKVFSVISVVTAAALAYTQILTYLTRYARYSRTIYKLVKGNLFDSYTRTVLYDTLKQFIKDRPLGYGPLASRKLLVADPYPHSFLYESLLDYGVVIGGIFFAAVIVMAVINLWRYRYSRFNIIIGYIEIIGLGSLMVSSSYFYEIYVPATIALFMIYGKVSENENLILYHRKKPAQDEPDSPEMEETGEETGIQAEVN